MHALGFKALDRNVDRGALAADDGLFVTVDVGDHEIAVDTSDDPLYVFQRCEHGGHLAIVFHGDVGHFAATCAHSFECFGERQDTRLHQRRIFAKAVAHDHVRLHAVLV